MKKKDGYFKRFVRYYKPHSGLFALDMGCSTFMAVIDVLFPLATRYALQQLLPNAEYSQFFLLMAAVLIAYVVRLFAVFTVTYWGHILGVRMEADMRRDIFKHLQIMPFSFYDKSRTGYLISRCTSDLFEITELAHHGPEDFFISLLTIIGAVSVMVSIEWRLGLVLLAVFPIMVAFVFLQRGRMMKASRSVKERLAHINSGIESAISGARVAKAFANEEYEVEKFDGGNARFVNAKSEYYKAMGIFAAGTDFLPYLLNIVLLGTGGYIIMRGEMDVVTLLTFTLYITACVTPLRRISSLAETLVQGIAGFTRFCEIMDIQPDIQDLPGAAELENVCGDIMFENVTFSYDKGRSVLKNVTLNIARGEKLALVGPSGGGKTTLCHLIPRFYEVDSGRILIDGRDIRDFTMHSLRKNIGIVQQDVFLFADTIRENIRYGRTDATDAEIIAAAKAAEIHDDIMCMPNGYDTLLGERGMNLSGGQKQRLSIARIFLKNPPVLILDEATSALDTATEARISAAFDRLSEGRTTLVIAHRLSTVRNADEIIVIDEEGIRERGTHDELMALNGVYAGLNCLA